MKENKLITPRRRFIKSMAILPAILSGKNTILKVPERKEIKQVSKQNKPLVISTWNFGLAANAEAWKILEKNGRALDAVEAGARVPESDPLNESVGFAGLPDRDGIVTLDACIMDEKGNAGSVCALENIGHPVSVARRVMEKTPHVILVGDGALKFALSEGFKKETLGTENSKRKYQEWLKKAEYKPKINVENHDTIGILAIDAAGNLSGACTTSGLAFKMHGRVGDSPIIGAGLYVDNEIGAATSTGLGELVIRSCGSFLVVELMRQGKSPQKACEEAVHRIVEKNKNTIKDIQVGFLAINKKGEIGAYSVQKGFQYALHTNEIEKVFDAPYSLK